jgi:DNA-binding winged helix-turn-helix (wHTH) protein
MQCQVTEGLARSAAILRVEHIPCRIDLESRPRVISMTSQLAPMSSSQFAASTEGALARPPRYVRFGSFHLDLRKEELLKDGTHIKLQGKVFQALVALLEKPGEVVTREALRNRLWPSDTHVNYDANVNTTVNKLRLVLGDSPDQPVFVDTIPRKGYSFVATIEYVDQPAPQPVEIREGIWSAAVRAGSGEARNSVLRAAFSSKWFAAGVISLVLAAMLFGAALILYAHRGI